MRNAPDMPKLIEDQSVLPMHRLCDLTPRLRLLAAVDAGSPGVTLALHRHLRCLADDQGGGGALRIVAGGQGTRHIARLAGPRAGQWRHHDAMPQVERAEPVGLEQQVRVWRWNDTRFPFNRGCLVHNFPPLEG